MNDNYAASHYSLIIEWSEEDHLYIATAPELPGCRTHGATRIEAVEKGVEAIESWLMAAMDDHWEPPAPRLFDGWSNFALSSQLQGVPTHD